MLASELLAETRDQGDITPDIDDATILRAADAEVRTRLLPMLRSVNEEYLVRTLDVVAVNGRVQLPPRAAGAAVRLVQLITNGQLYNLPRLDPALDPGSAAASGQPFGFYFDGGGICLVPQSASATLRVRYYARPGKLVLDTDTSKSAVITTTFVAGANTAIGVSVYTGPTLIDVIASGPAHQHKAISTTLAAGLVPTVDLIETPIVGDWIAGADTSPFVALPEEMGSVLALRTAARVLSGLGYKAEAAVQYGLAETAQSEILELLRPRSEGNPKRLSGGTLARLSGSGVDAGWRRW